MVIVIKIYCILYNNNNNNILNNVTYFVSSFHLSIKTILSYNQNGRVVKASVSRTDRHNVCVGSIPTSGKFITIISIKDVNNYQNSREVKALVLRTNRHSSLRGFDSHFWFFFGFFFVTSSIA